MDTLFTRAFISSSQTQMIQSGENVSNTGWLTNQMMFGRQTQNDDDFRFYRLAKNIYKSFNWFSLRPQEPGGCCYFQTSVYMEYGRKMGLSPWEYRNKVTDFSSAGKPLNFLMAYYDPKACANIITRVGFGRGQFRRIGVKYGPPFIFPFRSRNDTVHFFFYTQVRKFLTFEWFKENVVCRDQEWLCSNFEV
ncbi:uncharacterized protein LOC142349398 isoform X2 [Convolutriloba macropyga]|uniref:uncharacterized protein LOC142349398 isoform X2 n=1 Tax=Convolutriloba macropyga TaxID=536237 RepID=UPI003F52419F